MALAHTTDSSSPNGQRQAELPSYKLVMDLHFEDYFMSVITPKLPPTIARECTGLCFPPAFS